jgi:hypothetical protein
MTATLRFNLNDSDDIKAHLRCIKSSDMALALWDINNRINRIWDESEDGKMIDGDLVFKALEEINEKYSLNINELID